MACHRAGYRSPEMSDIAVTGLGDHRFGVDVTDGGTTTSHRVTVPATLIERWDLTEADEQAAVRESLLFLLEREPASSIMSEFSLTVISRYFPEYDGVLPGRLGLGH